MAQHGLGQFEEIDCREIQKIRKAGSGAFGDVYKSQWRGYHVAAKYFRSYAEPSFLTELRQLSRVRHTNIVALYAACINKNHICLVMEYADGGSLDKVLQQHKRPISFNRKMSWAKQCAAGVSYLHATKPKALIHRDLKSGNLLLFNDRTLLKIGDFGLVTNLNTLMTQAVGTLHYMAPEVFRGQIYTEKCDVYSFGIILWEIMSREIPYKGLDSYSISATVLKGGRPPIKSCHEPIKHLITACWQQDPGKRPAMSNVFNTAVKPQIKCSASAPVPKINKVKRTGGSRPGSSSGSHSSSRLGFSSGNGFASGSCSSSISAFEKLSIFGGSKSGSSFFDSESTSESESESDSDSDSEDFKWDKYRGFLFN